MNIQNTELRNHKIFKLVWSVAFGLPPLQKWPSPAHFLDTLHFMQCQ